MNNIKLLIKGFIMGIANIIPGVSGGTLAITLGIYEDFISAISNLLKNLKKNILFLLPIFIGMVLSIASLSNVIVYSFTNYALPTSLLFMGLIVGGIPLMFNKVKKKKVDFLSIVIFLFSFSLVMLLTFSNEIFGTDLATHSLSLNPISLIVLFLVGIVAASTMIIPGVSGSLVLMLLGYYSPIVEGIKELTHFDNLLSNFICLGIFGVGVILGIMIISKLIEWLFKKYETKTYYGVLGFVLSSLIAIPVSVIHEYGNFTYGIPSIIIAFVLFIVGALVGYKLGEK